MSDNIASCFSLLCFDTKHNLKLATVGDDNLLLGRATLASEALNLLHHIQTLNHLTEHNVLAIQPCGLHGAQEELGAICVGSSVGHGEDSRSSVLELEVLIGELVSVDALSTGTVVVCEVTSLAHEVWDDTMERAALEAKALLSGAQSTEVLCSLGDYVGTQLHDDLANRLTAGCHVKEYSWCSRHVAKLSYNGEETNLDGKICSGG